MQDHHTTSGSGQPEVDEPSVHDVVMLELAKAAEEIPAITLSGCLVVRPEVIPLSIGRLRPVCTYVTPTGEHRIPTPFVWKDLATNEVYCHIRCAAFASVELAVRLAEESDVLKEVRTDA